MLKKIQTINITTSDWNFWMDNRSVQPLDCIVRLGAGQCVIQKKITIKSPSYIKNVNLVPVQPSDYAGRTVRLGDGQSEIREKTSTRKQQFELESQKLDQLISRFTMSKLSLQENRPRVLVKSPELSTGFNAPIDRSGFAKTQASAHKSLIKEQQYQIQQQPHHRMQDKHQRMEQQHHHPRQQQQKQQYLGASYKFNMSDFRPEDISFTVTETTLKIHALREEMDGGFSE